MIEQPRELTFGPDDLRRWIEAQPAGTTFDMGSVTRCVVARFVEALVGEPVVCGYVTADNLASFLDQSDQRRRYYLPAWCEAYIKRLMKEYVDSVTATQAVEALAGL